MLENGEKFLGQQVPLCSPEVGSEEIAAISRVFQTGALSHGPELIEFEKRFSQFVGVNHAVALNSWTSAAYLVFKYIFLRHGPGEVILPSYTFVASANTVVSAGLTPIFVDVDRESYEITFNTIRPAITKNTRAIMPVHFAGKPCNMPEIMKLVRGKSIYVIEDSAECLGATVGDQQAGSFDIGIFSFYSTKNMTTGEGGMVTTNNADLINWLKVHLAHGIQKNTYQNADGEKLPWHRNAVAVGHNFRLSNMQAAMGLVQLSKLEAMNKARYEIAKIYDDGLSEISEIERPNLPTLGEHSFQMYPIKVDKLNRNNILKALQSQGVGASCHFDPPVHLQTAYFDEKLSLPITEELSLSTITLPISSIQTKDQTYYVIEQLKRAISRS
jgi:perosamine synthetase